MFIVISHGKNVNPQNKKTITPELTGRNNSYTLNFPPLAGGEIERKKS
jgi:hypothetical protein